MQVERLYANAPRVVHEAIDGEVIVIDLATGTYFSLQGGAANVWALIAAGKSVPDMVTVLAGLYDEEADSVRNVLDPFLAELQAESLVVADTNGHVDSDTLPELVADGAFSATLDKHTDMTELILLDPVHDVDSVGWPNVPQGQEARDSQAS